MKCLWHNCKRCLWRDSQKETGIKTWQLLIFCINIHVRHGRIWFWNYDNYLYSRLRQHFWHQFGSFSLHLFNEKQLDVSVCYIVISRLINLDAILILWLIIIYLKKTAAISSDIKDNHIHIGRINRNMNDDRIRKM